MRVLIDICHPAHVHFFRHPVEILRSRGHEILITSRDKEVTIALLDRMRWKHRPLSVAASGTTGLAGELVRRNQALFHVVRDFRPDCMAAIGGIFVAHVGAVTRTPSLVFYDTENARVQNLLTFPFASLVAVPRCYEAWLPKHSLRYAGYHELSYLHPNRFAPNREIALANGLDPERDTFLLRLVAWKANHDIGERGWGDTLLDAVVGHLASLGKVIISSERPLPARLEALAYRGDPLQIHHLMAFCRLHLGESATMASESVVLGVPAIYAAHTGRGYTNEQDKRYGLVTNIPCLECRSITAAIDRILAIPAVTWRTRHKALLGDTIDVAEHAAGLIEKLAKGKAGGRGLYGLG